MVHILFNLSEAVLVFAAVNILHSAGALDRIRAAPITSGGIANTHTLFNLACAVLLLPLCGLYEKLSRLVIHDDARHSQGVEHELQLLDDKFFTSPELALSSSDEAIATMARLACAGADSAMGTLGAYDRAVIETVQKNEQSIDMLADTVNNYLVRLSGHMEADDNSVLLNYYLQCFSEFERIGDYAVNLTESAEELHARGAQFSTTARQELAVLQDALHEIMGYAADAFTAPHNRFWQGSLREHRAYEAALHQRFAAMLEIAQPDHLPRRAFAALHRDYCAETPGMETDFRYILTVCVSLLEKYLLPAAEAEGACYEGLDHHRLVPAGR